MDAAIGCPSNFDIKKKAERKRKCRRHMTGEPRDFKMADDSRENLTAGSKEAGSISLGNSKSCCRSCIPARYVLCFLSFLGFFNVYALRVNLSVALVAMVNHTATEQNSSSNASESECPQLNTSSGPVADGPYVWSHELQGVILSSFFYGYIFTQIPGGWLAGRFGGKLILFVGVLATSVLTLLIPAAADWGPGWLIALRIVIGLAEGGTIPAMHAMWGRWAPPLEHSKLGTFCYSGMNFGTFVSLPASGLLAQTYGWPSVFYVFGAIGVLWSILWWLLVYDSPDKHPYISQKERYYIETSISAAGRSQKYVPPPWKEIWTSKPFIAIIVAHTTNNWGYYTLLVCLPNYMNEVQKFDVKNAGFITALPYLIFWIVSNIGGFTADTLRYNHILSTKAVRKIWIAISFGIPALFLALMGQVNCDHTLALAFVTLAVGINGLHTSAFLVNHLDIAPRFAGILMGITNTFATIPGMLGPYLVGVITAEKQTASQWAIVFYISAAVFAFGLVFFCLFADGEEQPWNSGDAGGKRRSLAESPEHDRLINNEET